MEPTVAKPGIGDQGWGVALNAHLDGMESDIAAKAEASAVDALASDVAAKQSAAALDADVAAKVPDAGSAVGAALSAKFGRKRALDVRDFGAVCDGVTDDTTAIQAAITAAGANGAVELPPLAMKVSAPLVLLDGTELRGVGTKESRLMASTDITVISSTGGQGQAIRNLKVWSTFTGTRTTYDIDINTPTKVVLEDVEVDLPTAKTGLGGIRLLGNGVSAGNEFMVQMSRVWVRQGTLLIDGVTDGHFLDGFVWAADDGTAAIHLKNGSHLWTFVAVDLVPSDNTGAGYLFESIEGVHILGGYQDGSYADNPTGYGVRAVSSRRIIVSNHHFFNLGRSGVRLESSSGCIVSACGFHNNNKLDNFYPDISLIGSSYNTFTNNTHSHPAVRTNKGAVYNEDTASLHNLLDASAIDLAVGNQYASLLATVNPNTLGRRNRPASLWPRPSGVPLITAPPASTMGAGAAATWPAANRAVFHRFTLTDGGAFRYANLRVEVASGNLQCAVVKMDGLNYTRVMDSGVIAAVVGNQAVDMGGYTFLAAGEYALVVWCSNTTAQFWRTTGEQVRGSRQTTEVSSLASGVPASGSIASWSCDTTVVGLTLSY